MDRFRPFTGVPLLNRSIVLKTGITTNPSSFSDLIQQSAGVFLLQRLARGDRAGPPFFAFDGSLHEFVAGANREGFVLIPYAPVGLSVIGAVIALLHQRPRFFLFLLLRINEFLDVSMPIAKCVHLRRAARLAAGLNHVGDLIVNFQERHGPTGPSTAAELFFGGADWRQIGV